MVVSSVVVQNLFMKCFLEPQRRDGEHKREEIKYDRQMFDFGGELSTTISPKHPSTPNYLEASVNL